MNREAELSFDRAFNKAIGSFSAMLGIPVCFLSLDGRHLSQDFSAGDSPYCTLIQEKVYGEQTCLSLDVQKRNEAAEQRKAIRYICHGGLLEMIAPVYIREKLIGFASSGQIRVTDTLASSIKNQCKKQKVDVNELRRAFFKLPSVSPQKVEHVFQQFMLVIDYVVSKELLRAYHNPLIDTVTAFLKENISRTVSLEEASRYAGKSTSTLSHLFKNAMGKSFKQYSIELKIDQAEKEMHFNPSLTVTEAGLKVGYEDPFQFSRLFKKYRGISPGDFLKKLRRP